MFLKSCVKCYDIENFLHFVDYKKQIKTTAKKLLLAGGRISSLCAKLSDFVPGIMRKIRHAYPLNTATSSFAYFACGLIRQLKISELHEKISRTEVILTTIIQRRRALTVAALCFC